MQKRIRALLGASAMGALGWAAGCSSTTIINQIVQPTDAGPDDATAAAADAADRVDATTPDPGGDAGRADATTPDPSRDDDSGTDAGTGDGASFVDLDASGDAACRGLACQVDPGCTTLLSGFVLDPAGVNPVRGAYVFVPNAPDGGLPPITDGTHSCTACATPAGDNVTSDLTDATGHFELTGVPAGTHIPLVVQIGHWRRETFLSTVTACTDNPVPPDASRLPRSQAEGNLPQMAVVTGAADLLECLPAMVGVAASEYTAPGGGGRVHVYQGVKGASLGSGTAGDCTTSACPLWSSRQSLEAYDLVLLGCEGGEDLQTKPPASILAMHDWLAGGGRVLADHFQYTWFKDGPSDFSGVAQWLGVSGASGSGTLFADSNNAAGAAFADYLRAVHLAPDAGVPLTGFANSVGTSSGARLLYDPSSGHTKLFSFDTPVGGTCGRAIFSDVHLGGAPPPGSSVPDGCPTTTEALKILEYAFFGLSACAD